MEILYRDTYLVAVNKPVGLLVHRSAVDRRATVSALQLTRDRVGHRVYPAHRLDRPTSGALLFALSPELASVIGAAFAQRQVDKRYLAVVRGRMPEEGCIEYPLAEEPDRAAQERECGAGRSRWTLRVAAEHVPAAAGAHAAAHRRRLARLGRGRGMRTS